MSSTIWLFNSASPKIITNSAGEIFLCDLCPCDTTPVGDYIDTPGCPCPVMPRRLCFRMYTPGGIWLPDGAPNETIYEAVLTYSDSDNMWHGSAIGCSCSNNTFGYYACFDIRMFCAFYSRFPFDPAPVPYFALEFINIQSADPNCNPFVESQGGALFFPEDGNYSTQDISSLILCSPTFFARTNASLMACCTEEGFQTGIRSTLYPYTGDCTTVTSACSPWPTTPWAFRVAGVNTTEETLFPCTIGRGDGVGPSNLPFSTLNLPDPLLWRGGCNYSIGSARCQVSEFTPWQLTIRDYNRTFDEVWELVFQARESESDTSPCVARKLYFVSADHTFWMVCNDGQHKLTTDDYISVLAMCPGNAWICPYPVNITATLFSNCPLFGDTRIPEHLQVTLYHQWVSDTISSPIWAGVLYVPTPTGWTYIIHVILDYRALPVTDPYGWRYQTPTCKVSVFCGDGSPENLTGNCNFYINGTVLFPYGTLVLEYDFGRIIQQSCDPYLVQYDSELAPSYVASDWTGLDCASFKTQCESAFLGINFQG